MNRDLFPRHIIKLFILLALTQSAFTQEKFKISKDVKIKLEYDLTKTTQNIDQPGFLSAESNLTRLDKITNNVQFVNFVPDLTVTEIISGMKTETGLTWGIECKGKETDLCILSQDELESTYNGIKYNYQMASTVMDVSNDFSFEKADPSLKVRLITKLTETGVNWPYKATGILGLAKGNDLFTYIRSQYDTVEKNDDKKKDQTDKNEFIFSLMMKVNPQNENDKFEGKKEGTFDKSYLSINGYTDSVLIKNTEVPYLTSSDPKFWSIDSTKTTIKQDNNNFKVITEGLTCMILDAPGFLAVPKDQIPELTKYVMNKLCGSDTCDKKNSDITKGPSLYFEFKDSTGKDQNFEVKPEKYIWSSEDSDKLRVAFDELETVGEGKCPTNSKIGFSRLFFVEKYFMFKRIDAGAGKISYEIGIGDKIDIDDLSKIWIIYSISLGILGFMVVIFILKTICLWNRGKKVEGGERNEEDAGYSKV